jgi:hypothetical protein
VQPTVQPSAWTLGDTRRPSLSNNTARGPWPTSWQPLLTCKRDARHAAALAVRAACTWLRDKEAPLSYGSCRSLWSWRLVGVGVPSLMSLLGAVLVAASP